MSSKSKFGEIISIIFTAMIFAKPAYSEMDTVTSFELWSTFSSDKSFRVVRADGLPVKNVGCAEGYYDSYAVLSTLTAEEKNRMYSTLLAAKIANKPVTLFYTHCDAVTGRPGLRDVILK